MSINKIIEEQKEFFKKVVFEGDDDTIDYIDMNYSEFFDYFKEFTEQILEAEVERLKGIRNTRVHCCQSDEGNQCEYDECLDDQITHLTNIIKEIK